MTKQNDIIAFVAFGPLHDCVLTVIYGHHPDVLLKSRLEIGRKSAFIETSVVRFHNPNSPDPVCQYEKSLLATRWSPKQMLLIVIILTMSKNTGVLAGTSVRSIENKTKKVGRIKRARDRGVLGPECSL